MKRVRVRLMRILAVICVAGGVSTAEEAVFVEKGRPKCVKQIGPQKWKQANSYLECFGERNYLYAGKILAPGDFHIRTRLSLQLLDNTEASFIIGSKCHFYFDGRLGSEKSFFLEGPGFGENRGDVRNWSSTILAGKPFDFEVFSNDKGKTVTFRVDGKDIWVQTYNDVRFDMIGLAPWRSTMRVYEFSATGNFQKPRVAQGKPVFVSGREGYHTYRIPAIVVSNKGTVLAFCEGRKTHSYDDGDVDIVLKRSFDNGKTWSDLQLVYEQGGDAHITIGNPVPVVDRDTGTIWLFFGRNFEHPLMTRSNDDGVTWAKPVELTGTIKASDHPGWFLPGPGHGIQLKGGPKKGRLVVPAYATVAKGPVNNTCSFIIYSDNHGRTWKRGGYTKRIGSECLVCEMPDGDLYMTIRGRTRKYAWSRDGGETWEPVQVEKDLMEPTCQASVVQYIGERKNLTFFCNPASRTRKNMTIRFSRDNCENWSEGKVIHQGPSAYSDLAVLTNGELCCLYEAGYRDPYERIDFASLPLEYLLSVK